MAKTNGNAKKPMTKSEIMENLATEANLTKKEVARILEGLTKLIEKNIGKRGPGVFNVPGLLKVMVIRKPATAARKGINPFTGLETMFKAKPARNVVKIRPLKGLKDMV
jgi:nucleoid DNA-binding protein